MGASSVPEGRIVIFRVALVVGLGSVVATIIYLTPIPDHFPQSCQRPCHELDWPMICRVKMIVERIPCRTNDCKFAPLTVNRQIPGPPIQVCENDILVVDVTNKVPGSSLSVHWRGQTLKETPHMDGVSMITQCPILPHTTFQYKFRASEPGSHLWQFMAGEGLSESLFGSFIVKQSDNKESQIGLYDTDSNEHVMLFHVMDNTLNINGQSSGVALNMSQGLRHRLRVAFGGRPTECRIKISVNNTALLLLSLDGHPIRPQIASSVQLSFGETIDLVVQFEEGGLQYLEADLDKGCEITGQAVVSIQVSSREAPLTFPPPIPLHLSVPVKIMNDEDCQDNSTFCLDDLRGREPIPAALKSDKLDHKIFLFFGVRPINPGSNISIIEPVEGDYWRTPHINNRTFLFPPSPLMSQPEDIDSKLFCDGPCSLGAVCECLHVLKVPLGESVEIILIHQDGNTKRHVFHLHGNSFYVVGASQLPEPLPTEELLQMEADGRLIAKNLTAPVLRDTISMPARGVAALRFIASNPGFWLLDDELTQGGAQVVLQVGAESDLPNTPKEFPRCGSWVGPEFFLT